MSVLDARFLRTRTLIFTFGLFSKLTQHSSPNPIWVIELVNTCLGADREKGHCVGRHLGMGDRYNFLV